MAYDEIAKILTVSELDSLIKATIKESFYQLLVEGEVSSFKPSSTGHWFFNLKDDRASISCIVFRSAQYNTPQLRNGDIITAIGSLEFYEKSGAINLIISKLMVKGDGRLKEIIEKRKAFYSSLGYFDIEHKKPLPQEIKTIGVVTSPTGAAFQDILNITKQRAPSINIIIFPCLVQGEGSGESIASRIRQANSFDAADVLIVGRGGGSDDDLLSFSTDEVIEAIYSSHIPVISAVGHEVDYPISDSVADLRAPTPSAAAMLATETIFKRRESFDRARSELELVMSHKIRAAELSLHSTEDLTHIVKARVEIAESKIRSIEELKSYIRQRATESERDTAYLEEQIVSSLITRLKDRESKINSNLSLIAALIRGRYEESYSALKEYRRETGSLMRESYLIKDSQYKTIKSELEALSPLSILERGYAVLEDKNGKIVRDKKNIRKGDTLKAIVHKGEFEVSVTEVL